MADIILVVGGNRSGKSDYAQQLAMQRTGSRTYVATSSFSDPEMASRISKHRAQRHDAEWSGTIEEATDLSRVFDAANDEGTYLVDSVGMWVNNLLFQQPTLDEERLIAIAQQLFAVLAGKSCTVIFVADEVGLGVIAADAVSRRFCDLNGRMNQLIAAAASHAVLVSCGLPLRLK